MFDEEKGDGGGASGRESWVGGVLLSEERENFNLVVL